MMEMMGPRSPHAPFLVALTAAFVVTHGLACGAEGLDAPPDPPDPPHTCIPPRSLAPSFFEAIESESYEGLREMVRTVLAACTAGGEIVPCNVPGSEPPAAGILLSGLFVALGDFAADEPEFIEDARPGSPGYCAPLGQVPSSPNRLCTVIRSLDRMIVSRDDDGGIVLVAALDHLRPLVADLFRYVDGSLHEELDERYRDLVPIRRMVRRCDDMQTIALLSAIMELIHPPKCQEIFGDLITLLENEDLEDFLSTVEVEGDVGRRGMLALARVVLGQLLRDDFHPDELESTLEDLIYPFVRSAYPDNDLETDMRRFAAHLLDALDPQRRPAILDPLGATVECALASDPDERLLHAGYDLIFRARIIGLNDLFRTFVALLDSDPDGAVLLAADLLLRTMADMREVNDATKHLLRVLLDEPGARVVLPAAVELLESDVLSEVVALADQFLTACGGAVVLDP